MKKSDVGRTTDRCRGFDVQPLWSSSPSRQLVRTCARRHHEKSRNKERLRKEEEMNLRLIAATIAREVEFFWSNIEQVRSRWFVT